MIELPAEEAVSRAARRRGLARLDRLLLALEECNLARVAPPAWLVSQCHAEGASPQLRDGPGLHAALLEEQLAYLRLGEAERIDHARELDSSRLRYRLFRLEP